LRRGFTFTAPEPDDVPRYLYNARWPEGERAQLLLVLDDPADTDCLRADGGLLDVLTAAGEDVVVAVVPATDPAVLRADREER
ncbi:MAG: TRSP domain-containing protein, partial [Rhodococcus ruber]|nr:TRSP domain-containing protein [Rhodococcus ruber]